MIERAKRALSSRIRSWAVTATSPGRNLGNRPAPPGSDAGRMSLCLGYWDPAGVINFSMTWSIEKLAGFCRGGNSLKVCRNFPT